MNLFSRKRARTVVGVLHLIRITFKRALSDKRPRAKREQEPPLTNFTETLLNLTQKRIFKPRA